MQHIIASIRASLAVVLLMTVLLGGVYPLLVMGAAQTFFTYRSSGSLIERGREIRGSFLLGQNFDQPRYFWGRLSATTPPYNAAASGGSNLGAANPTLLEAANGRIAALQKADPANKDRIPVDLVTASGSGVDPHISLAAVEYQLPRVAGVRNMKIEEVQALVDKYTEKPGFGLLGAPYINVIKLNMALDEESEFGVQGSGRKKK